MLDGIATTGSERDAMAGAAMVALRLSMDSGYRDVFDTPNYNDRTALRARRDFQLILHDLDFPADPFAH